MTETLMLEAYDYLMRERKAEKARFEKRRKGTNADKIRSMTDEELAGWLERIRLCCATDLCGRNCPFAEVCYSSAAAPKETLDWLKQEVNK